MVSRVKMNVFLHFFARNSHVLSGFEPQIFYRRERRERRGIKQVRRGLTQIYTAKSATKRHKRTPLSATESTESTEGLRRRRLKNALRVIAGSVLDTSPPKADKVSAVSFSAPTPAGYYQPAAKSREYATGV